MEAGRTIANSVLGPDQTARRLRPRLRRVRITRRPVCERMRTRNPETRLRLRLVPPRVRFVMMDCRRPTYRQFANLSVGWSYCSMSISQLPR